MKNYRSIGNDEESPSNDEQHEQQHQARLEAFALKRKATIGVCVYAAAMASTMLFAYSRHGSSSSSSAKTNDHKVLDLHAVKTSMQTTDFTRLNQQVEAMLDQKQSQNNRKLIGGPAGAQAKADASVSGVSSSSSSTASNSSSSASKSSVLSAPALSTADKGSAPQGTSGTTTQNPPLTYYSSDSIHNPFVDIL